MILLESDWREGEEEVIERVAGIRRGEDGSQPYAGGNGDERKGAFVKAARKGETATRMPACMRAGSMQAAGTAAGRHKG